MDVPLMVLVSLFPAPIQVERIFTPGAKTSITGEI